MSVKGRAVTVDPVARRELAAAAPLLPKDFTIEKAVGGVRLTISGRSTTTPDGPISGSVRYDFHFVTFCDSTSIDKIEAAYNASTIVESIPEPGIENKTSTKLVTDGAYASGYWFVSGVAADGSRSAPSYPRGLTSAITDDQMPPPVQRFQVSESGIVHNGVTFSELSMSYIAPKPLQGFAKMQPIFLNYPALGQMMEGNALDYYGLGGGSAVAKIALPQSRRKGLGTVTATYGVAVVTFGAPENCNVQVAPGDVLEILGQQGTILTVDSPTQVTLTATWKGVTVVALADYYFIGLVRVYARSVGQGGAFDPYLANLPYADVILDGNISYPVTPTVTLSASGNVIRVSVSGIVGTGLKDVILYRAKGGGPVVPDPTDFPGNDTNYASIKVWPVDGVDAASTLTFEDHDFSLYDKSMNQEWSYTACITNVNGDISFPASAVAIACRLDAPGDGGPSDGANGVLNLLWDGMLYGTVGNTVATGDASQNTLMGGVGPAGPHDYWDSAAAGGTAVPPGHQSETEIVMPMPGGAGFWNTVLQDIGAWDNPTVANRLIERGRNVTFQIAARSSSATPPNGHLRIRLLMMDSAGNDVESYRVKLRASDDSFDYTEIVAGAGTYGHVVDLSVLSGDHELLYCTFSPQTMPAPVAITNATNATPIQVTAAAHGFANGDHVVIGGVTGNGAANGTWTITWVDAANFSLDGSVGSAAYVSGGVVAVAVEEVRLQLTHIDSDNGNNLYISRVMLSYGDGVSSWTADMPSSDIYTTPPGGPTNPDPPGNWPVDDGRRDGRVPVAVP